MYIFIAAVIVAADQLVKWIVSSSMFLGEKQTIINNILDLYYIQNNGAAFSILQGRQSLLIIFTILVMAGFLAYLISFRKKISRLEKFSIALILGGGVGNLIDRVMQGYVVDFIDIHIIPIFNIADIAITCGCILFAIAVLISGKDK